jgi:4'-phosphopantetheinyl transferase
VLAIAARGGNDFVMRVQSPEETLALAGDLRISPGEIHVWALLLTGAEGTRQKFAAMLTSEELARAGRYYFQHLRDAFVFSRGQMRQLLARYCGVEGQALRFVASEFGKPAFAPDQSFAGGISFNFTHSGGRALLAVTAGGALGVDLECHDRKTDVLALAERYFFGSEYSAILHAPEAERAATFFHFWTAKEAVIKAQGTGLSAPLDAFRVELGLRSGWSAVETFDTSSIDAGWFVTALPCEAGWSGAVVAKGNAGRIRLMTEGC